MAIGGYIEEGINSLIGYITGNEDFIEVNVCPIPELEPSEERFLQVAGKYSYSGGGKCSRCVRNTRVSGATMSNGGKRNLKGTKENDAKLHTEAKTSGMKEREKKLQSDKEALNELKLEMERLRHGQPIKWRGINGGRRILGGFITRKIYQIANRSKRSWHEGAGEEAAIRRRGVEPPEA